jgi:hypothetical protein
MTNKTTMKVLYRFVPFCVAASMMTTVAAVGMLKPNSAKFQNFKASTLKS